MDINSKKNKKENKMKKMIKNISVKKTIKNISIKNRIIVLSICISLLPILLALFNCNNIVINEEDKFNNSDVKNEIITVVNLLDELNKYKFPEIKRTPENSSNSDGIVRKSAVNDEIEELKKRNKAYLDEVSASSYDDDASKKKTEEAEKEYNKSDDEYKNEAIKNIENKIETINSKLKTTVNIEYYYESNDGNMFDKNVSGPTIIDYTIGGYSDYIIYTNKYTSSASDSMKCIKDLIDIDDSKCEVMVIRISRDLISGDAIYESAHFYDTRNSRAVTSGILLVLDVLIILILILVRKKDLTYKQNKIEKLYSKLFTEVKMMILIFIIICFEDIYQSIWWRHSYKDILIQGIICCTFVYLALSDIFNILYTKGSIADKSILKKLYRMIKKVNSNLSKKKSMYIKLLVVIISIVLDLSIMFYGDMVPWWLNWWIDWLYYNIDIGVLIAIDLPITFAILLYVINEFINIYKIDDVVGKIVNGNYTNDIKVKGFGITKNIAQNINNIQSGFSDAIDEAVKSEKMKTELITNVSHDLKTPLTSIINYVDLLSKDNISEEEKKRYLEILNDRSLRLKVLIEDLFEAAKATSGTLEYNLENLNPAALLRQALGEFEDKIESCNLTIIKGIPENKLSIIADGKKTFRVVQNLLSNIIKYSMKNSRVYIDIIEEEQYILMVFKNMSAYQLNFTEEEILERFKRGDSSRTTEGNGLGLSIAKSLVEGQGGLFKIIIDGDLFKVEVRLKKQENIR